MKRNITRLVELYYQAKRDGMLPQALRYKAMIIKIDPKWREMK